MDIVEEIRKDRERGAKRLVSEYKAGLMSLARRFCRDPGDAEELVNRTFAAVIEGIDDYLEQSAFFAWMCQILTNIHTNDNRRKSNGEIVYPGTIPDVADEAADDGVYRALDASLLRDAIETLPEDIRKTLMMHYFMDLSVKEIARVLTLPSGTVLWRLHYARKILATRLGATAKKHGGKAVLLALMLCGLTALGAGARLAVTRLMSSPSVAVEQQADNSKASELATNDMQHADVCVAIPAANDCFRQPATEIFSLTHQGDTMNLPSTAKNAAAMLAAATMATSATLPFATSTALADAALSDISVIATTPGTATVTAEVAGPGDVFAEYAYDKSQTFRSVKDRYVTDGLLAMWDAVDNMGIGSHVPDATTWRDLAGNHSDMTFTAAPTIGATYYDLSAGGCGTPAADIGAALNDGTVTIEIVCNVHSLVNDSTLFACVDGTNTSTHAAGNRIAWIRHTSSYAVACCEYKETEYHSLCNVDPEFGMFKSYVFGFNRTDALNGCVIVTNGVWAATVNSVEKKKGNAADAWFSLAQRVCAAGASAAISDLRIHCVRIYNRTLTNAEMAANLAVDRERFEDTPSIDLDHPGRTAVVEQAFVGTVKEPVVSAKGYYANSGLIAMWDGEDNQGTGAHVAGATTWKDLTGNHADMAFANAPTVGANYYDVSAGGGGVAASDIAAALNAGAATVEIVCDVSQLVADGTLFACVDGTDTSTGGAGNRIAWVRSSPSGRSQGVVAAMEYKATASYTPYPNLDMTLNAVRSYTFKFGSSACQIYRNGADTGKTCESKGVQGNAANAWFSLGQRICAAGSSAAIMQGRIYCVRVYNRELTAGEIAANHAADVRRFYSAKNMQPLGSVEVVNPDGTSSFGPDGRGVFHLTGLRPDLVNYTVRLYTTNAAPAVSPSVTFESAAERPAAAWYEYIDSRNISSNRLNGPVIDLNYAANGHAPSVETRYQILGGDGHAVFGAYNGTKGTYAMQLNDGGVSKFRYRLDASGGGYAELSAGTLAGVQELVFNDSEGTYLNGDLLDASLAGQADTGTDNWILFGRYMALNPAYQEAGKTRVWYFRLFSDGTLIRDLVPACGPDGKACCFDRVSRTYYPTVGTSQFSHGPEQAVIGLSYDPYIDGGRISATATRTGTAASDVYVAYGASHGGANPSAWEHFEQLPAGFGADETTLNISQRIDREYCKYVRFLSLADGWSDSIYVPSLKAKQGFTIVVR